MDLSSNSTSGVGFIITMGVDQTIKLFDISKNKAECLFTLRHESHINTLALSPDNSLLAVGGQNSEIYVWSLSKDQKLLRSFFNPSIQSQDADNEHMQTDMNPLDRAVLDINWSNDGNVIAAAIQNNVVMLDLKAIIKAPLTNNSIDVMH